MSLKPPIRAGVLTISDRCASGETEDTAGPALQQMLVDELDAEILVTDCVPDEPDQIAERVKQWSARVEPPDLILTAGGTGLAPRDITPEAIRPILEREHMGLINLMQMRCYEITRYTYMSRGIAGTVGRSLVITLPGSRKGGTECLGALIDVLEHAIKTLRGDVRDHGPKAR